MALRLVSRAVSQQAVAWLRVRSPFAVNTLIKYIYARVRGNLRKQSKLTTKAVTLLIREIGKVTCFSTR